MQQMSATSQPSPTSPSLRKRQRTLDHAGSAATADGHPPPPGPPVGDDAFINDHDAADSGADDDDDDEKPKDKKAGRRKIKIEFIQDKSRRHITFSKRKAGIMKKAYELSTLTGTQVLLLVVSETGLVYTFTTAKLQPLVTQPEGKNLIQACLNAPHGTLPSALPVGQPMGRSNQMSMPGPPPSANMPGGLSISGPSAGGPTKEDDGDDDHADDTNPHGGRPIAGDKRRRRNSSTSGAAANSSNTRGGQSPHSPNATIPPPLNIPGGQSGAAPQHASHPQSQPQINLGSPTSPSQQHQQVASSSPGQYAGGSYPHHPSQQPHHQAAPQQHDGSMYPHMMPPAPGAYTYPQQTNSPQSPGQPQLNSLANAAHWQGSTAQPVGQGGHYGRR